MNGEGKEDRAATLREMLADKEKPRLAEAAELALSDRQTLDLLLEGLVAKEDLWRYHCFQVLYLLSEEQPEALYAEWDNFVSLLDSDNSYHRSIGVRLIANLARCDGKNRLERIFDRYFGLLDDDKIVTARYLAQHAGRIAHAKPILQERITERLLAVDETHHAQSRKDLLKGDVLAAFDEFFDSSPQRERILDFAEQQLASTSPRTRKTAREFLKRHRDQG